MSRYTAPDNFYNDWQTPPGKTKKTHVACHLSLIEDFKKRHDNIINISRKKALTKHENVVVKAFFCQDRCESQKVTNLKLVSGHFAKDKQGEILTCPKSGERLCGYEVETRICPKWSQFSRRANGDYIDGAKRPED